MTSYNICNDEKIPSNTKFGWFFVTVFGIISIYMFWKSYLLLALAGITFSVTLATVTLFYSNLLSPLNSLWYKFGILLGKFISPIVLGIIFFVLITPVSLITRIFGRDVLVLKKRSISSYWIDRDTIGPSPESFKNQF
jgi:hypothetical protein